MPIQLPLVVKFMLNKNPYSLKIRSIRIENLIIA